LPPPPPFFGGGSGNAFVSLPKMPDLGPKKVISFSKGGFEFFEKYGPPPYFRNVEFLKFAPSPKISETFPGP